MMALVWKMASIPPESVLRSSSRVFAFLHHPSSPHSEMLVTLSQRLVFEQDRAEDKTFLSLENMLLSTEGSSTWTDLCTCPKLNCFASRALTLWHHKQTHKNMHMCCSLPVSQPMCSLFSRYWDRQHNYRVIATQTTGQTGIRIRNTDRHQTVRKSHKNNN